MNITTYVRDTFNYYGDTIGKMTLQDFADNIDVYRMTYSCESI